MAASKADHPPRFVVQCAKGKGWKSLVLDENQSIAERAFREVVKVKPKGYFRLIRLDHNPNADYDGLEFKWKLLELHDPKRKKGGSGWRGWADSGWRRRKPGEKVPIPLWLYILAIAAGLVLAVVLFVVYGPPLTREPPPVPAVQAVPATR